MSCQVYEGTGVEHPLSDRAVAETAGQILAFQGRPGPDVLPLDMRGSHRGRRLAVPRGRGALPQGRAVPRRGRAALWDRRAARVRGSTARDAWRWSPRRLAAALGVPPTPRPWRPAWEAPRPVRASTGWWQRSSRRGRRAGGASWQGAGRAGLLELLRVFRLPLAPPPAGSSRALGAGGGRCAWRSSSAACVSSTAVSARAATGSRCCGRTGRPPSRWQDVPRVIERQGERWRQAPVTAQPGSSLSVWCAGEVCPVVEVEPRPTADDASSWSWWRRELSLDEIGRRLQVAGVRDVRVDRRGYLGPRRPGDRAATRPARPPWPGSPSAMPSSCPTRSSWSNPAQVDGKPGLRFLGRGWGHGVGMCQNGAYGLAIGGASFAEILAHYYPGTVLGALPTNR